MRPFLFSASVVELTCCLNKLYYICLSFLSTMQQESYRQFWNWFNQNQQEFYNIVKNGDNIDEKFFSKLSPELEKLGFPVYFLTGVNDGDVAELIFTVEGKVPNMVFIEELVAAAPAIANWSFIAHKPAIDPNRFEVKMEDFTFGKNTLCFYSNDYEDYPDEIDITLVHDAHTERNSPIINNGSLIFLDNFLGELKSVLSIDRVSVTSPNEAEKELVPIEKLPDFLTWREKEFVEKYDATRYNTENDEHAVFEGSAENNMPLIAAMNVALLGWDAKPSHPWLAIVSINYDGTDNNGLPDKSTVELLDKLDEDLNAQLQDKDGYLYVGRKTGNGVRDIYFACKEFRNASKIINGVLQKYTGQLETSYDIFKDKYWMMLEEFNPNS